MIVLGADMHKRSHTIAAVAAGTGELAGEKTVDVGTRGFAAVLDWARGLGGDRVWALEDCRHVSGAFERFPLGRGASRPAGPPTPTYIDAPATSRRSSSGRRDPPSVHTLAAVAEATSTPSLPLEILSVG